MNGFDVQSATQVSKTFAGLVRRAHTYDHSRDEILDELQYLAMHYAKLAERIDQMMEQEAA